MPARYRGRVSRLICPICAFARVRIESHASQRLRRRVSRALVPRDRRLPYPSPRFEICSPLTSRSSSTALNRHVVLPPDIAKLLPKGRLLSEVRFRIAIPLDADTTPERRRYRRLVSIFVTRGLDSFLPPTLFEREFCERPPVHARPSREARGTDISPLVPSLFQAEWRGLGVQQSRGWVHYAIHRPEPHIMLYRSV